MITHLISSATCATGDPYVRLLASLELDGYDQPLIDRSVILPSTSFGVVITDGGSKLEATAELVEHLPHQLSMNHGIELGSGSGLYHVPVALCSMVLDEATEYFLLYAFAQRHPEGMHVVSLVPGKVLLTDVTPDALLADLDVFGFGVARP